VGGFEFADGGADLSNQFQTLPVMTNGGAGNAVPTLAIRWYALKSGSIGGQTQVLGTEAIAASNLTTFTTRLRLICV
jgi:hypothetical protein